jgi:class 3 adenylate cyclase
VICPNCGTENAPGAKFCSECGTRLADAPAPREERKVVSVVFCDVVGSTARAESADPEDVRAALNAFYAHVRADLARFGGTVEKYIGDAVMAVFGAPVAHEDDAERAVRAALAIRDWAREDGDLQVRIAVNTGEALVAVGARAEAGEAMVAGDVVNTAARLQSAAPENGVLVGEATHRATREAIDYEPTAAVEAKGKSEPVAAWVAVEARGRVAAELTAPATPLVGRERERELLLGAFARARDDRSTELVTIIGVPGIGKSRLVAELYAELEQEAELTRWRHGRSLPYGEGLAFWALAEMVRAEAGIRETDPALEAHNKLEAAVRAVVPDTDAGWIEARLRPMVGLGAAESSREESFGAWRRFLEALAEQRPTVLVFEDLHWAGDELLDFVDELADWVTDVPLLVVATARPELIDRRPGWGGGKRNAHTISLAPLGDDEAARLIASLLDRHLLPAETQQQLLERAGGNPLYAEQFARMLEEHGGIAEELPDTVQAIIAARLDSLPPAEKALLLDAAVLGRTFWAGALAAHEGAGEHLRSLQRKEFVRRERRSTVAGEEEFSFAHLLVRDVAYAQIPRSERAEKHARTAAWIESLSVDRSEDTSELLAYHYLAALELRRAASLDTADLTEPAIGALVEAVDRALALSAMSEAARYATALLELLAADDPRRPRALLSLARAEFVGGYDGSIEKAQQAVEGFLALGDTESAADAEVLSANWMWNVGRRNDAHAASERALELVAGRPPSWAKAAALVERSRLLMIAGSFVESTEAGLEGLALAEQFGDEVLQARALITLGAARNSDDDLLRGIELADRANSFLESFRGKNNLGEALLERGELVEVEKLYASMEAQSRRVGWAEGLAWLDAQRAGLHYQMGDWETMEIALTRFERHLETHSGHAISFVAPTGRALLAEARGDGALAEESWRRALELARLLRDAQPVGQVISAYARFLLGAGRSGEAAALTDELLGYRDEEGRAEYFVWLVDLGWLLHDLGRGDEVLAAREPGAWADAGAAVAAGDLAGAADRLGAHGFRTEEAYARLRLAEELAETGRAAEAAVQRDRALAFYREVGATAYVRRGEALLAASA